MDNSVSYIPTIPHRSAWYPTRIPRSISIRIRRLLCCRWVRIFYLIRSFRDFLRKAPTTAISTNTPSTAAMKKTSE